MQPNQEVGKQTFVKSPQIAIPHINGLIPLTQIRKFLRCDNPKIANLQIFMINPQIANLQFWRNTALSVCNQS